LTASELFLIAVSCYLSSAITALVRRQAADVLGAVLSVTGSVFGIWLAVASLNSLTPILQISTHWQVPGGSLVLEVDSLSGAFLLVIFAIAGLGSVHGLDYWRRSKHPESATRVRFFYALMTTGLILVFTARSSMLFLPAWELMAISAFFLVATEDQEEDVRRAAWIYLVATHIGTICLFAAFGILRLETGSFLITGSLLPTDRVSIVFLLALVGFGFKAGLVPLHFWLPSAHANAPSHVSALMSGVMLKAGIYGILRITSLVTVPPVWWSLLLGLIAATTAVAGISLALTQTDIKRALAYSSVENMGIVCLGIALALAGRSAGEPLYVALGLGGAIAHVWSHGAFKSLLFFAAGSVLNSTHSRSMDRMGGLMKRMPLTGWAFVTGSLAACGMPLFNGFISEWLIALGFFHAIRSGEIAGWILAFAAPAVALAGALALASFLRIVGIVFLGEPRTAEAAGAQESSRLVLVPLACLGAVCVFFGVLPGILASPLAAVTASWSRLPGESLSTFLRLPYLAFAAILAIVAALACFVKILIRRPAHSIVTWDCGYVAPTPRMQYTAGSAGEWFSHRLLPEALRPATFGRHSDLDPRTAWPPLRAETPVPKTDGNLFPSPVAFRSIASDPFSFRLYEPFVARWTSRFERLRRLQQGRLTIYLVYILLATIGGVAWAAVRGYLK